MGGLQKAGMVTDACWVDHDNDGDPDLVVVGDWMKVSVFVNEGGHFTNVTSLAGLDQSSGWWNCVKAADLDLDGDMDLVCGNLGLNSMLRASTEEPVEMFLNDFDNNGVPDQIITAYDHGISYPIASLDELTRQIIGLENKYPEYSGFGGERAEDIFGTEQLGRSYVQRAVLFESCIFINNGAGGFEIKELPAEAQFSPLRDLEVNDLNNDDIPDLILAGNNYGARPSLGRQDACHGWLMLGKEDLSYEVLKPVESGFSLNGDIRKIHYLSMAGSKSIVLVCNNGDTQVFNGGK
jgi:hypothetical protein